MRKYLTPKNCAWGILIICIVGMLIEFPATHRALIFKIASWLTIGGTIYSLLMLNIVNALLIHKPSAAAKKYALLSQGIASLILNYSLIYFALSAIGPVAPKNTTEIVMGTIIWCSSAPMIFSITLFDKKLPFMAEIYPWFVIMLWAAAGLLVVTKMLPLFILVYCGSTLSLVYFKYKKNIAASNPRVQ